MSARPSAGRFCVWVRLTARPGRRMPGVERRELSMGSGGRWQVSRRDFLETGALGLGAAVAARLGRGAVLAAETAGRTEPLTEFGYGDVDLASDLHETQLRETHAVLMALSDDSLLKPFRQMSGQPSPGDDLGGGITTIRTGIIAATGQDSRRDAHSGSGCRRWRAGTRSRATKRRARRCCG